MKRNNYMVISLILCFLLLIPQISGCGSNDGANSDGANQGANEEVKPIELVYSSGYAKNHPQVGVLAEQWMEKIYEATEGRVKMRGVYSGALLKAEDTLEGVMKQTADAGSLVVSFWPGQLKLTNAISGTIDLDLGNKLDLRGVSEVTSKIFEEFPEFTEEYQKLGVTPLFWVPSPPYAILFNDPVETVADLQGKKVRSFGGHIPKLLEAGGAVPLTVAFGEIYTSLQTGVLDGAMTDPPAMLSGKFEEVSKHLTTTGPTIGALTAAAPVFFVINNDSFSKLSEKDQEIVKQVSREMIAIGAEAMAKEVDRSIAEMESKGVTVHHLSEAETQKWADNCPDWYSELAETLNKDGYRGTEIVNKYLEFANDYIAKN
ncbi:MAG: TRAP transporter substrate-binding protein DctP [Syntrophomonadaceae bacterium]